MQFTNVYVINRACDVVRMKKTHNILLKNNIKYTRFPAVTIETHEDLFKNKPTCVTDEMYGCGLSHLLIWQKVITEKLDHVIIFEDDIYLKKNWKSVFKKATKSIPKNWDILTLGNFGIKHKSDMYQSLPFNLIFYMIITFLNLQNKKQEYKDPYVCIPYFFTGLYGYSVSYKGAKKLLSIFKDPSCINFHIDVLISKNNHLLNIYSLIDDIVYQRNEQSTINKSYVKDNTFKLNLNLFKNDMVDNKNINYNYYMNVPVLNMLIFNKYNIIINGWFILFFIIIMVIIHKY